MFNVQPSRWWVLATVITGITLLANPTWSERVACKVGDHKCGNEPKPPYIVISARKYKHATVGVFKIAGQRSLQVEDGEIQLTRLIFYPENEPRECESSLGSSYTFYESRGAYVPHRMNGAETLAGEDPHSVWRVALSDMEKDELEVQLEAYQQLESRVAGKLNELEASNVNAATVRVAVLPSLDYGFSREAIVPIFEDDRYLLLHSACLNTLEGVWNQLSSDLYPAEWFENLIDKLPQGAK